MSISNIKLPKELIDIKNVESFRMQPDISQKKQCGRSYMSQRDLIAHVKHRHDPNIPIKINSDH